MTTPDRPFESLQQPIERQEPRPRFARELRARLVDALGIDDSPPPTVDLPSRRTTMTTTSVATGAATPYLAVADADAALRWYADTFGAVEQFRVVDDSGAVGHAEFTIGPARFMISDAFPDYGAPSPQDLGGSPVMVHLEVGVVDDVHRRAVEAGATSTGEPADQPHGSRHCTVVDPFGHRWMLSQPLRPFDLDDYAAASAGTPFTVVPNPGATSPVSVSGGIWAALNFADAPAGIRFMVDVLGFEEQLVVPNPEHPEVIEHSQLRWPEGGVIQAGSANRGTPYSDRPTGAESIYVITADPAAVHERVRAAGATIIEELHEVSYGAGPTLIFTCLDPEGNIWSFGQYGGEG